MTRMALVITLAAASPTSSSAGRRSSRGFTSPERIGLGKYLTIWQKSPNGSWKFVQDGGSSSPPPAP